MLLGKGREVNVVPFLTSSRISSFTFPVQVGSDYIHKCKGGQPSNALPHPAAVYGWLHFLTSHLS